MSRISVFTHSFHLLRPYFMVWLLLTSTPILGQDTIQSEPPADNLFIDGQVYVGKMLNIHPEFPKVGLSSLFDIGINFQTLGKRDWHQDLNYPEIGISFSFANFGNNEILGQSFAIIPSLSLGKKPLEKASLEWRFGAGLAWFNKPYDLHSNPENVVNGSRFAVIVRASGGVRYRLSNKFSLRLGGELIHYSNGHTAVPNVGTNIIGLNAGLKYYPDYREDYFRHKTELPSKKLHVNLKVALGFHEIEGTTDAPAGPTYAVYSGSFYVSKRFNRVHNGHLGLDYHYYTAFHDLILHEDFFDDNYFWNSSTIVLFIGDEMMIGRLSFVAQLGYNLYNPFKKKMRELGIWDKKWIDFRISAKVGLQYYPFYQIPSTRNKVYVGLYLKTISGKADFAEVAIGYTF